IDSLVHGDKFSSPSRRLRAPSPRARGEVKKQIRSRDALTSELCPSHAQASSSLKNKGGGAPTDASDRRPHRTDAARACPLFLSRLRRGGQRERARLSALHRGIRGCYPSTRPRAALPGTTGCKREDPPRHQCSEHLAVRSRAGRDDAQSRPTRVVTPRPGYRSRSALGVPSRRRPRERDGGNVTISAT